MLFLHQTVIDFQQGVHDGLTKSVGRYANLVVAVVARGDGEIAAFVCNNSLGPFDCPKGKVAAARDRHRLVLLIHDVYFRLAQHNPLSVAHIEFMPYRSALMEGTGSARAVFIYRVLAHENSFAGF